jgi:putative ATPase
MSMPLAEKLRPHTLDQYIGQQHLIGKNKPICKMIDSGKIHSMILWGPPGSGKTTLANIIANSVDANFVPLSAVTSSIKELKAIVEQAKQEKTMFKRETIVFVDEIHRFNKAQQDAFLPWVESGIIILIGATTENPGFEVISPLLSRTQLYTLNLLSIEEMRKIVKKATEQFPDHKWKKDAVEYIVQFSSGDARIAINAVEVSTSLAMLVSVPVVEEALQKKMVKYDKKGDYHYDTISAFIKSMRGSQPSATLHYLARMIKAGEDPVFIARRMVIFASEDIGNALPTALVVATSCMQAVQMIGMPEAQIILAQAATYLATAKKSTTSYSGLMKALSDIEKLGLDPIPLHLRNPSNKVMKEAGYGKGHIRYPWQEEAKTGQSVNQEYMPENLVGRVYY